jgi:hypothetical protein
MFDRSAVFCTREWFRLDYSGCTISQEELSRQRSEAMMLIGKLANTMPRLRIWDAERFLCRDGICPQFLEDKPLFRDTNHLSYWGARNLGAPFEQFVKQHWLHVPRVGIGGTL